jgi:hypothetical protein
LRRTPQQLLAVVAADAAVVDSVATTAMRMSFEQAQVGANVTDPLLSRRRWPNGPGTEGHRIKGKRGAPQSACYGHATGGLSAYYPGRISTVTAIFPARIFKILCGFFRPEFSYIFFRNERYFSDKGEHNAYRGGHAATRHWLTAANHQRAISQE